MKSENPNSLGHTQPSDLDVHKTIFSLWFRYLIIHSLVHLPVLFAVLKSNTISVSSLTVTKPSGSGGPLLMRPDQTAGHVCVFSHFPGPLMICVQSIHPHLDLTTLSVITVTSSLCLPATVICMYSVPSYGSVYTVLVLVYTHCAVPGVLAWYCREEVVRAMCHHNV